MFKSRTRPLVFTQYEHGRLAGTLAQHWGNPSYSRPSLNFAAFVEGVTLHDWAYGIMDNLPIGELTDDQWLKVVRTGIDLSFDHPTTDIVVKLHLRRLLALNPTPEREVLIALIDDHLAVLSHAREAGDSNPSLEEYRRADRITQLCDMISFDFCFESQRQRTFELYNRPGSDETSKITYEIRPDSEVRIFPWPFSIPNISGILYAFQRQEYPHELTPVVVPFNFRPE